MENILETQRPRLESAGLELEWVDDSQGAMAKLDPDALEQVLLNLLDNLVKYAVDGKYAGVRLKKESETVSSKFPTWARVFRPSRGNEFSRPFTGWTIP